VTRVLFVCIGNSCRSQMAEAFARAYGPDVIEPTSAGLQPCHIVSPATLEYMLEKNIDLNHYRPKGLIDTGAGFDLIVNMSGFPLPAGIPAPIRVWKVDDPIAFPPERHRQVRDQIERLVQSLIIELRRRTGS
jgi:arsenate reductase (thioredoxin)